MRAAERETNSQLKIKDVSKISKRTRARHTEDQHRAQGNKHNNNNKKHKKKATLEEKAAERKAERPKWK